MINAGDLERADVRVGDSRPQRVMLGDTQVWPPPRETRIHLHVDTEWSANYSPADNDGSGEYIVDFGDGNATMSRGLVASHDYAPGDYVLRRLTEDGRMQSTLYNLQGNMFGDGPEKTDKATEQVVGIEIGGEVTSIWGPYLSGLPNLRVVTIPSSVGNTESGSLFWGSGLVYAEIGFRRNDPSDRQMFKDCAELRKIWIRATTEHLGPKFIGELHDGLTVYCEADSKPAGWDADWNLVGEARVPVVWGQKRRPW